MLLFVISNTRCQEFFSNIFFRKPESTVLEVYLGICTMSKNHNHEIHCADAYRHKDVSKATYEKTPATLCYWSFPKQRMGLFTGGFV